MPKRTSSTPLVGRFRTPRRGDRSRQPGGFGLGSGGECICPECDTRVPHGRGIPCYTFKMPKMWFAND